MREQTDKILETKAKQFLRKYFLTQTPVEEKVLSILINTFELVSFKKGDIIINAGADPEYFYFIYKGIVRTYFYKNEKMVIERFDKEGAFFGTNFAHLTKRPDVHVYDALEDVVLLRIKIADFIPLHREHHEIERLYRLTLERLHSDYINNFYKFASLTSEEKYHQFILDYGDIANRIPLKYIANYLGMTSETLSRIRAKYDRNNRAESA